MANILNVAINEFFKVLAASKSSFLVRSLLGALAISRAILPVGWPEDFQLAGGEQFGIIVVGSGSAGAIVAARLAEISWLKVLLIEAGGDPPPTSVVPSLFATLAGTEYDWNYKAQLDKGIGDIRPNNNQLNFERGKVLGGSSSVNYLVYSKGVPPDYDDWGAVAPGWDWDNVLHYHKKYEDMMDSSVFTPENSYLHSTKGPVQISRPIDSPITAEANEAILSSFREIGIPEVLENNGPEFYGVSRPHYIFANGRRSSTAEAYLRYNKADRPNLYIAKYSRVTKLLIHPGTRRIEGVEVLLKTGYKVNVYAKLEVIVSAGTIDSPKLLMLSGIGPKDVLNKVGIPTIVDLPVGQNLQDHVFVPMTFAGKAGFGSALNNLLVPTKLAEFPVPFLSSYFKLNSVSTRFLDDRPIFQTFNVYIGAGASLLVDFGCRGYGYGERVCSTIAKANLYRELDITSLILLHPESRGSVTLRSNNPLDDPYIELGFLRAREDLETLREGMKFFRNFENTTYFRKNGGYFVQVDIPECNAIPYNSDRYWECLIRNMAGSMLHPVGTCSMGPGGVVDERLRVYGLEGLRIIDASVMPTIPSGNTNAPAMMIGEKGADLVKEDYGFNQIRYTIVS